jgi:demethylmenaquinone methyltransferase/2-methoxy-6-polyprenyl-1,4-benzoquinol methylase
MTEPRGGVFKKVRTLEFSKVPAPIVQFSGAQVSKERARIKAMFAGISRRYDFLNHLLSLNVDRRWRRRAARELGLRPGYRVLDVCTGTADLALELCRHLSRQAGGEVLGADFCEAMVRLGERKRQDRGEDRLRLLVADTLRLPFADGTFDAVTVAFGIRNVCDLAAGIAEMHRVLRPGGRCAILEFTTPRWAPLRRLYNVYFHRVLPRLGRWISGSPAAAEAYAYLPASVDGFLSPESLAGELEAAGFERVRSSLLTGGIAVLLTGARREG